MLPPARNPSWWNEFHVGGGLPWWGQRRWWPAHSSRATWLRRTPMGTQRRSLPCPFRTSKAVHSGSISGGGRESWWIFLGHGAGRVRGGGTGLLLPRKRTLAKSWQLSVSPLDVQNKQK